VPAARLDIHMDPGTAKHEHVHATQTEEHGHDHDAGTA
jgi:hypothetical protein